MFNKLFYGAIALALAGCSEPQSTSNDTKVTENTKAVTETKVTGHDHAAMMEKAEPEFNWVVDRFADYRVLRYQVPGFEELPIKQKQLLYFLSEAALSGRDIIWDQNYRLNLTIRRTMEEIVKHYQGDKSSDLYQQFLTYTKQLWFAGGIHHHSSNNKFTPNFTSEDLQKLMSESKGAEFPLEKDESVGGLVGRMNDAIFNPDFDAKKVNKAKGVDKVAESAVNFYNDVNEQEVRDFYAAKKNANDETPPSYGLNSQLTKQDGKIIERVWKVGGMYSAAIERIVFWLEKASAVSENAEQKLAIDLLVKYYKSGELKDFDDYSIAWVKDIDSDVDVINGFIEVYSDPLAYRGSFESVVSVRNPEATKVIAAIADKAQWFEDHMPMADEFKKDEVKGITGKSIIVVMESGDASPSTPIGINLPNANWIRANHGSKSVSLGNIVNAYNQAKGKGLEEFAWDEKEVARVKKYGSLADDLTTDMHEVIGHASGKINPGVGTPKETMKQYSSTLEEARADLVGLYFIVDPILEEIGVSPSGDVGMAAFDGYIRNGMMQQLRRIKLGDDIEEDHMRNRQLVATWSYEKGFKDNVIEKRIRDNKTYFVVNDYGKLRAIFGELLGEIQRIKSEGDYEAAEALVENYGVKVDQEIHKEVLARYEDLNVAPYSGFVNPNLVPVMEGNEIIDVKIVHPKDFEEQMLNYAKNYSFLPNKN
ncbi:MAG: dihydrofolate reductase [Gammaproteobacteria bacterium]|nr:dihydrofolate reductase [Gammaproteobacteria bacterium]